LSAWTIQCSVTDPIFSVLEVNYSEHNVWTATTANGAEAVVFDCDHTANKQQYGTATNCTATAESSPN